MKKFFRKFFRNKSKIKDETYKKIILPKIMEFSRVVETEETISFMHYGHLGDIINSLPIIKELSKSKICNLYIQKNATYNAKLQRIKPMRILKGPALSTQRRCGAWAKMATDFGIAPLSPRLYPISNRLVLDCDFEQWPLTTLDLYSLETQAAWSPPWQALGPSGSS